MRASDYLFRAAKTIPLLLALLAVWVIMNEQFNLIILISGIVVGIIAIVVTRLVTNRSYADELWLGWRAGILYFPYLLWQIILAAIKLVGVIISGRDEYVEFSYHSTLPDDLSIFLLASSITLTPGTIVIGRNGSDLTVLAVGTSVDDAAAGCALLERGIARLGGNRRQGKLGNGDTSHLEGPTEGPVVSRRRLAAAPQPTGVVSSPIDGPVVSRRDFIAPQPTGLEPTGLEPTGLGGDDDLH